MAVFQAGELQPCGTEVLLRIGKADGPVVVTVVVGDRQDVKVGFLEQIGRLDWKAKGIGAAGHIGLAGGRVCGDGALEIAQRQICLRQLRQEVPERGAVDLGVVGKYQVAHGGDAHVGGLGEGGLGRAIDEWGQMGGAGLRSGGADRGVWVCQIPRRLI